MALLRKCLYKRLEVNRKASKSQQTNTCSKSTIEIPEKGVKNVGSWQQRPERRYQHIS